MCYISINVGIQKPDKAMTHILTIETNNTAYFERFKKLARKLGVNTIEKHDGAASVVSGEKTQAKSAKEKEELFYSLFGSWEGDETGDELIKQIYSGRISGTRDIEL